MEISPVAFYRGPLPQKFGLPRQAGLAEALEGRIVLEPAFRKPEALRGLDGFDYLWLVWEFNLNRDSSDDSAGLPLDNRGPSLTVRPPRLGGNERVGVFASRSPFRPNRLGLSSVRIAGIDFEKCEITVLGADLADCTPIYDIKPYVAYSDSHPDARSGFAGQREWQRLEVRAVSPDIEQALATAFAPQQLRALFEVLSEDPRPAFHNDPSKEYGLSFAGHNIRFRVDNDLLLIVSL
jgi:tRNA-Thr(GGU) m(6)t(6)A37 methyltransferase TsaA